MSSVSEDRGYQYVGTELELAQKATNWKAYWRDQISEFVRGNVLEVGAGIGSNTKSLAHLDYRRWVCLEPDAALASQIDMGPSTKHETVVGTIDTLPSAERFDTILYIDVLEHIEDDSAEMIRVAERLTPGGAVIVLSPAHPFLFTAFDAEIGHYRRYTRASLRKVAPTNLQLAKLVYLDAVGILASGANRFLLRSAMPTEAQILTWDRGLIPLSRYIDPALGWRVGKSILGVWRREV